MELDKLIEKTADPDATSNRLQALLDNEQCARRINEFSDIQKSGLVQILGISRFLSNFLNCHPEAVSLIGTPYQAQEVNNISDVNELRLFKYHSLLQITWMDVCNTCPYEMVLSSLSHLADTVIQIGHRLVAKDSNDFEYNNDIAIMALGKLGANELNYSSDVDILFVLQDSDDKKRHEMHKYYTQHIRRFCRLLTENTEDGFLYRVDLNLRPWGRSAPLTFSLEEYEEYYQSSKEAWERIAWLRGRYVAGSKELGAEMVTRLKPFVYHKSLSAEDIERFFKIKRDMSAQREKEGHWNIKLGAGGIRDIEFFVQMLQIINGGHQPELQITSTVELLKKLNHFGFINNEEVTALRESYIFLRRLENRLQMIDEQQTHQLPNDKDKLQQIAIMMGYAGESIDEAHAHFNNDLILHQQTATKYFDTLLTENADY
ncbi:MAG: glutamate-ammonia-ligase adenylyltransferase [Gammaproteobacteria bacterium]|jgi:glutamate-ammonia-ligase adenylyltransferase